MSLQHGINTYKKPTRMVGVTRASVGIPLFVGCAPIHKAGKAFEAGPVLVNTFDEARELLGYSEAWRDAAGGPKWSLCQAAYGFLRLFQMAPCYLVNVYDPTSHKTAVAAADLTVADHAVMLPEDAIDDARLVVKTAGGAGSALVKGTDYDVIYTDDACVIDLLEDGSAYSAESLNVAYNKADLSGINAAAIEAGIEQAELCKGKYNIVPDLLCAPGWSQNPTVAAVMAAKADNINGLFHGMAVVDLDTSATGADSYDKVLTVKDANGYTDENMAVCWPLAKVGDRLFDMSVIVCGVMCRTDTNNGDLPYESPSNKAVRLTGLVNKAGTEIPLTALKADSVSYYAGVVTAINFGGWRIWGNYTGCFPGNSDPAYAFICCARMMDFLSNSFVNTFWSFIDRPMNRVLIDAIVNTFNSFLDGLKNTEALLGGEIAYVEDNNPAADLLAGKFRLDLQMASALPAQQINLFSEFSVDMLVNAINV